MVFNMDWGCIGGGGSLGAVIMGCVVFLWYSIWIGGALGEGVVWGCDNGLCCVSMVFNMDWGCMHPNPY